MALTPLASIPDLAARAGEDILADDLQAGSVLSMASALVRAYVGHAFDSAEFDEIPDAVRDVTVDVAFRVWTNPDSLVGDSVDDATRRWAEVTGSEGFYLTKSNKLILDEFRKPVANRGLWTLGVEKGEAALGTLYVPTAPPPGPLFPWYSADDPLVLP